jgi:hypothetical protein
MRQPTTCQAINHPALVVCDQPHKEATFGRCPWFLDSFPWSKKSRAQKESIICRLSRVLSIGGEPPYVSIFNLRLQLKIHQKIP